MLSSNFQIKKKKQSYRIKNSETNVIIFNTKITSIAISKQTYESEIKDIAHIMNYYVLYN